MSTFNGDFSRPEGSGQPNVLDKEALLALLAASGVAELATIDDVTTVYIDSTPKDKGELYMNPEGKPVYGFMTKFSEGFTGWKQGDLVRARFVVNSEADQTTLLVADSYVGDIHHADKFVLEGDPNELAKLRGLGVTEIDVDVEVTSEEPEKIVSDMFKYTARVDRVNNILAAWDGESKLTPGQVLVQGRVQKYVAHTDNDYKDRRPTYITLDVNGKPVDINMNLGYIEYGGSPYKKLLSETPGVGDIVQVLTTYDPDFRRKQTPYGRQRESAFDASCRRSTYCLALNPDRAAKQEAFYASVENMISELADTTDHVAFRHLYGKIIKQTFVDPKSRGPVEDLRTDVQQKRMAELVDAMFDEDARMDKPLLAVAKAIPSNQEFGIDLYSMSVSEAYAAVMEIAQDPSKLDPKTVCADYLFRVVKDALTPEQRSVFANTVIDNYYPVAVRQGMSLKNEEYVPKPGEVPKKWRSIIESAIFELSETGLESDIETLTVLFEGSIANGLFVHEQGSDFMSNIAAGFEVALLKAGTWTADKGYKVTDRERLQLFTQTILPRLITSLVKYTIKIDEIPTADKNKNMYSARCGIIHERLWRTIRFAFELEAYAALVSSTPTTL